MFHKKEITVKDIIDAPVDFVFRHWFDPPQMVPPLIEQKFMDFRLGGGFETLIATPDGKTMMMRGHFRDIRINKRIVCEWSIGDISSTFTTNFTPMGMNKTIVEMTQVEKTEEAAQFQKHMLTVYLTCLKAVFKKMKDLEK